MNDVQGRNEQINQNVIKDLISVIELLREIYEYRIYMHLLHFS